MSGRSGGIPDTLSGIPGTFRSSSGPGTPGKQWPPGQLKRTAALASTDLPSLPPAVRLILSVCLLKLDVVRFGFSRVIYRSGAVQRKLFGAEIRVR